MNDNDGNSNNDNEHRDAHLADNDDIDDNIQSSFKLPRVLSYRRLHWALRCVASNDCGFRKVPERTSGRETPLGTLCAWG